MYQFADEYGENAEYSVNNRRSREQRRKYRCIRWEKAKEITLGAVYESGCAVLLDMGNFESLTDELRGEYLTGQYVVQVYEKQGGVYKYVLYYYADDETGPQLEKIGLGGIKTVAIDPSSSPRLEWCTTYECFEREAWGKWIEKRKGVKEFGRLYLPDDNWKIHDMSIGTWTTHNDSYD